MLMNPYLKHIHPYYRRRLREAPINAIAVIVCMALAVLIAVIPNISR
jgi:hypothetical protein